MKIFQLENQKLIMQDTEKVDEVAKYYASFGYGDKNKEICQSYLLKSDLIIYFEKDNRIVGAIRALSDEVRFAYPIDLFVDPAHRKQGIGSALLKSICQYYSKKKIKYIEFNTDPQDPGLEEFYKKLGCLKHENSFVFKWPSKY